MVNIPTARDAMSAYLIVLRPDEDIFEAIDVLVDKRVSGAPVLDDKGELVGILTEKDCLRILSNSAYGELAGGTVGDYMSPVKVTLSTEMGIFGVVDAFLQTNFPILPVLHHGKLVGRVSRLDLLQQIRSFERRVEQERAQEERERYELEHPSSIERMQRIASSHTPKQLAEVMKNRYN